MTRFMCTYVFTYAPSESKMSYVYTNFYFSLYKKSSLNDLMLFLCYQSNYLFQLTPFQYKGVFYRNLYGYIWKTLGLIIYCHRTHHCCLGAFNLKWNTNPSIIWLSSHFHRRECHHLLLIKSSTSPTNPFNKLSRHPHLHEPINPHPSHSVPGASTPLPL